MDSLTFLLTIVSLLSLPGRVTRCGATDAVGRLCAFRRAGALAPAAAPVASPLEGSTSRPVKDEPAAQWPPAGPWLWSEPQLHPAGHSSESIVRESLCAAAATHCLAACLPTRCMPCEEADAKASLDVI